MGNGTHMSSIHRLLRDHVRRGVRRAGLACVAAIGAAGVVCVCAVLLSWLVLRWTRSDGADYGWVPTVVAVVGVAVAAAFAWREAALSKAGVEGGRLQDFSVAKRVDGGWVESGSVASDLIGVAEGLVTDLPATAFCGAALGLWLLGGMIGRRLQDVWTWQHCDCAAVGEAMERAMRNGGVLALSDAAKVRGFAVRELTVLSKLPGVGVEMLREGRIVVAEHATVDQAVNAARIPGRSRL
ncbi:MAG: hypothetical protein IT463_01070 [Planctomycetes bacterium]|nr:hypothetical protein [Planctomycetota bacterium]